MWRLLLLLSIIAAVSCAYFSVQEPSLYLPSASAAAIPESGREALPPQTAEPIVETKASGNPVRLLIPAISLNKTIVPVGTNSVGEMDVPSGKTQNVGWYSKGTVPGETGSAVFGAHVYAALSKLHKTNVGDEIVVETENGGQLRFVVTKTAVYKLGDLTPDQLFNRKDGRYLHIITCAGAPTSDGSTYTHRLVVYATLAD